MMIDTTAVIGKDVTIGEYVVIEKYAVIGDCAVIGNHAVIKEGTIIGNDVSVAELTVLGRTPSANQKMVRKPARDIRPLIIGNDVKVGSNSVVYRGATIADGVFIGDLASVRERVKIGKKSIIGRNAMVENNTHIGARVTIQTSAYVTADMAIEDEVFIGPCFSSSNDKYMGDGNYTHQGPILKKGAKIGNHATLLPSITIGEKAIVGAGAVVTKNVLDHDVVVGNPAISLK